MSEANVSPAGEEASAGENKTTDGFSLEAFKKQFSNNTLIPLIIGGSAIMALIIALFLWAGEPTYRVLYNNLSEAEGGAIIAELEKRGIDYRIDEQGTDVMVPSEHVHKLRLQLAEMGLPETGDIGFDIMDDQPFGISQFAEQVNFQRAIEGELAQSIENLSPVEKARVHLAITKPTVFVRDRDPSKASVVVTLHPGKSLSRNQSAAIARMVANSVPELKAEDVSIVDQNGQLLSSDENVIDSPNTEHLTYIQNMERVFEARVENILSPIFGSKNIRVQVATEVDFSRQEETSEQFRPNQGTNEAAVRSVQTRKKSENGLLDPGGIPGAMSNTPPGWAPSPVANPEPPTPPASETSGGGATDYSNTTNYEVDRSVIHTQRQPGKLQRLTAAIVINYRDSVDEEGNPVRSPIDPAELRQVEELVKQALGFTAERGDQIQVVNTPFAEPTNVVEAPAPWWLNAQVLRIAEDALRYFFAGLGALLLHLIFLRPMIKRHRAAQAQKALAAAKGNMPAPIVTPGSKASGDQSTDDFVMAAGVNVDPDSMIKVGDYSTTYQNALGEVREMAQNDPQLVALTVRSWMNKK